MITVIIRGLITMEDIIPGAMSIKDMTDGMVVLRDMPTDTGMIKTDIVIIIMMIRGGIESPEGTGPRIYTIRRLVTVIVLKETAGKQIGTKDKDRKLYKLNRNCEGFWFIYKARQRLNT